MALELRQRLNVDEVCGFADLRVDSVLLELARSRGPEFSAEVLDPLRAERDGSLARGGRVYVEAGGNLNDAARRLSMHRNTMLYKLDRISRLLQRDLGDPKTSSRCGWRALRAGRDRARVNRDLTSG